MILFRRCFGLLCFLCFMGLFLSPSTPLSDSVFGAGGGGGRTLLQVLEACPINFEFSNYTIITSQCRGPRYPPKECCSAFKEFACPYAEALNNVTNDCAVTMFSYINIYGGYPPGLFASECREGEQGLACPALPPSQSPPGDHRGSVGLENASGSRFGLGGSMWALLMMMVLAMVLFGQLF